VLSRVLEPTLGFRNCSFSDEGDKVIKQLKRNYPTKLAIHADKIIRLIEEAQDTWLVELIKMRDQVTHLSSLEGFKCFKKEPYVGGGVARIHYPTMPNKQRVSEYCQNVWEFLLSFCENFIKLAIEAVPSQNEHPT